MRQETPHQKKQLEVYGRTVVVRTYLYEKKQCLIVQCISTGALQLRRLTKGEVMY